MKADAHDGSICVVNYWTFVVQFVDDRPRRNVFVCVWRHAVGRDWMISREFVADYCVRALRARRSPARA